MRTMPVRRRQASSGDLCKPDKADAPHERADVDKCVPHPRAGGARQRGGLRNTPRCRQRCELVFSGAARQRVRIFGAAAGPPLAKRMCVRSKAPSKRCFPASIVRKECVRAADGTRSTPRQKSPTTPPRGHHGSDPSSGGSNDFHETCDLLGGGPDRGLLAVTFPLVDEVV